LLAEVADHHAIHPRICYLGRVLCCITQLAPLVSGDAAELLLTESSFGQVGFSRLLRAMQRMRRIIAYSPH
jgi:hypothetical protein